MWGHVVAWVSDPDLLDPNAYGSRGEKWHPTFVDYMVEIATHPSYLGMPDAIKEDGRIQWEAPSNRKSGLYQRTHHRRRDWWRAKALSIGIDPESAKWISRTAKRIHPTLEKPVADNRNCRFDFSHNGRFASAPLVESQSTEVTNPVGVSQRPVAVHRDSLRSVSN